MSLVSVHYLSWSVKDGRVSFAGSVSSGSAKAFALAGLQPEEDYTIDWGDGGATTAATTDTSGEVSKNHTYAEAGAYTIEVTKDSTSQVVAVLDVVAYGTVADDGEVTAGSSENFVLSVFKANADYTIDWGDGTATTAATTDGSGTVTKAHTYDAAGNYTITVTEDDADDLVVATYEASAFGTVADDGTVTANASETFSFSNFADTTAYTIDWGDGTATTALTTNGSGAGTKTHTYADAGVYLISVELDSDPTVVTEYEVTAFGTVAAAAAPVTEDESEGFTFSNFLPDEEYTVEWGDTTTDPLTTDGSGAGSLNHTYADAGAVTILVKDGSDVTVGSLDVTVVTP